MEKSQRIQNKWGTVGLLSINGQLEITITAGRGKYEKNNADQLERTVMHSLHVFGLAGSAKSKHL
jgi:hypothetical protein